ncbi:MAG: hypothetical protein JO139_03725 [Alphaproteobacteria bacterium]|nr:hypothetical protein [Alphaproteobacteria bacterium]
MLLMMAVARQRMNPVPASITRMTLLARGCWRHAAPFHRSRMAWSERLDCDRARRPGELSWETLATSLARLFRDPSRPANALALRDPASYRFSEWFEMADLKSAKNPP